MGIGCFGPFVEDQGVYSGHALENGEARCESIELDDARAEVRYWVGTDPAGLLPRSRAHIVEGAQLGWPADAGLVSLLRWRQGAASDESWRRTEAEILLFRGQLETRR